MRRDELRAAWSIFTPLLHSIDRGEITPEPYPYGSRGPAYQDRFLADSGYLRSVNYIWRPSKSTGSMGVTAEADTGSKQQAGASSAKANL